MALPPRRQLTKRLDERFPFHAPAEGPLTITKEVEAPADCQVAP
jgi:hypothetical protein